MFTQLVGRLPRRSVRRTWGKTVAVLAVAGSLAFAGAGVASADNVTNNLDGTVDITAEVMPLNAGGSVGTTTLAIIPTNGDGKNGCNLTGGTTLTLSIASSVTSIATVSPASVTFTSCGDTKTLTVTPIAEGTTTISATQTSNTSGGTFDLAPATFTVNVTAPAPANTAPSVSVSGVTDGASYDVGSVPDATCHVTDAEDGNSSFPATLSDVTGPDAVDGIGVQTASCSYTDAGGLKASSSVTYSIVDPSAPSIGYTLDPADPNGTNDWYTGEVKLHWTVTENESPNSLSTSGCVDQDITADQIATDYTCSASSAGGSAGPVTATIKRDGTAPTVTGQVMSTPIDVGGTTWYADSAHIDWSATDPVPGSGVAEGQPQPASADLGEGFDQTANSSAADNAGNIGNGQVSGINVDASAPQVTATITSTPAYNDGTDDWYKDSVDIAVSANDPDLSDGHAGSGLATDPSGTVTRTSTGSYSAAATDNVGHSTTSNTVSFKVDSVPPTTGITCPTGNVVKGSSASASWSASDEDGGSGLATPASGTVALDTSTVGSHTATAPAASDNVGHTTAGATCSYSVVYNWAGFFQPIDNSGVFNVAKAGSAIPVKFSLSGDQGLGIFPVGPTAAKVSCDASAPTDTLEQVATSTTSGLKYDSTADQYNYTWKTGSGYAGTCQKLIVTLNDGTTHTALFKFTK